LGLVALLAACAPLPVPPETTPAAKNAAAEVPLLAAQNGAAEAPPDDAVARSKRQDLVRELYAMLLAELPQQRVWLAILEAKDRHRRVRHPG